MIMKADNMTTFEEALPAYLYAGSQLHRKYPQFEMWELINEAYLRKSHENVPCSKDLIRRIKWDMLDYIRNITGAEKRAPMKQKFFASLVQTDMRVFAAQSVAVEKQAVQEDELNRLMKRTIVSIDDRELLYLYFYRDLTMLQIADMKHLSESRISQKMINLMLRLKAAV